MASKLLIKRGDGAPVSGSIDEYELVYDYTNNQLYTKVGSTITAIGAAGAVDSISNFSNNRVLTASDSDSINGESNLTFTGSALSVTGTASVTSSITTGYGVAFTNGATNFLMYNNTNDNLIYLRDTTNGQMLQTWTTTNSTIHKNLVVDGGLLTVDDGGDANEGGEIIINPGTSHSCIWRIDSFHGHLRFFGSTTSGEQMALTSDGNLSILTGTKFSLDGRGGHTYIQEESDGNVVFYADNRQMLRLHEGNGEVVINDPQLNTDFRVESDGRDKMLFVDASADIVAINGSGLGGRFNITESTGSGNPIAMRIRGYDHAYILSTQNSSATGNPEQFRIEHYDGNVRMNSLRGSLAINEEGGQNVGINTSSPSYKLDVAGDIRAQNGYQYYGDSTSGVLSTGSWAGDLVSGQSYERVCGLSHDGGEFVIVEKGGRVGTLIDGSYFAYEAGSGEGGGFYSSSNSTYGAAYGFEASGGSVVFQAADESWSNPVLEIRNTATSSGSGPSLVFGHSQSGTTQVARIESHLLDGSNSGRAGNLEFWTSRAGTPEIGMQLQNDKKLKIFQAGDTTDYLEIFVDDSRAHYHHGHTGTSGAYHRFITDNGYIELGPSNTGWGHIQTDRSKFYFNKQITVDSGIITAYDEDLSLRRASDSSADRIDIAADYTRVIVNGNEEFRVDGSGALTSGQHRVTSEYQVNSNGTTLRRYVGTWTSGQQTHDVIYNAYASNLGDYVYLKASGNSTTTHGMLINSDKYLFWGRDNLVTGDIDNSATAPMTDVCMRVDENGNGLFDGDVVAYSTTIASDARLKENVKDLNYGLKDVLDIRPVSFDWIDKRDGKHDIGVIAQEIEKIIPEVVVEVDTLNSEDTHKTVDYAKLTSVLIKAVQEQQQQINDLKEKLNG